MPLPIESTLVSIRETSPRMTPVPASRRFGEVLAQGGRAILSGAITAAAYVPGGNLLTAAVRGMVSTSGLGGTSTATVGSSGTVGSIAGTGTVEAPGTSTAAAVPGTSDGTSGLGTTSGTGTSDDDMLARSQDMSMKMLQLQEALSEENRRYTALSNVLHSRYETAKNAIGNIR